MKVLFIFFISIISYYSEELETKIFDKETNLHYSYLKEVDSNLSLEEIKKSSDWKMRTEIGISAKPEKVYWFKIPIQNLSTDTKIYFQEILPSSDFEIYIEKIENGISSIELNEKIIRNDRTITYSFSIPKSESRTIWIKATSKRQFLFFRFLSSNNLLDNQFWDILFIGFTTGSLISFIAYNLFLFFGTKDFNYLRYVIFIIITLSNQLFYYGTFQELTANYDLDLSLKVIRITYLLSFVANTYFVIKFIRLKEINKTLNSIINILISAILIGLIGYMFRIFAENFIYGILRIYVIPIGVLFLIGMLFYFWKWKKIIEAKFIFQSYLLLAILVIHQTLSFSGTISMDWLSINGATLGVNIQVFLFSLALADRLRIMKIQKEEAEFETIQTKLNMLESFIRFVPKDFLQLLKKDDFREIRPKDSFEGEMTVLFSDIRNFTTLSESISAKENFEFINLYFEKMNPIILKHGGFVDKFIGDGIMAIFPKSSNSAYEAVMEMNQEIQKTNFSFDKNNELKIKVGFGLHKGNLMLGTVGTDDHMETTVIGDTVNQASRLESMTKEFNSTLVISGTVFDDLNEEFKKHFTKKGDLNLKGKMKKTNVYAYLNN